MRRLEQALKGDLYNQYTSYVREIELCRPLRLKREVLHLHSQRKIRYMKARRRNILDIVEGIQQDQAYRSRLLEIRYQLSHLLDSVYALQTALVDTALCVLGTTVPRDTKTERKEYLSAHLSCTVFSKVSVASETVQLCDAVIEDIDKAAWAYKNLVVAYELSTRPEKVL